MPISSRVCYGKRVNGLLFFEDGRGSPPGTVRRCLPVTEMLGDLMSGMSQHRDLTLPAGEKKKFVVTITIEPLDY